MRSYFRWKRSSVNDLQCSEMADRTRESRQAGDAVWNGKSSGDKRLGKKNKGDGNENGTLFIGQNKAGQDKK